MNKNQSKLIVQGWIDFGMSSFRSLTRKMMEAKEVSMYKMKQEKFKVAKWVDWSGTGLWPVCERQDKVKFQFQNSLSATKGQRENNVMQ